MSTPEFPGTGPDADDLGLTELTHEQREVAGLSQGQIARRRFVRHKLAMVGLATLLAIVALAVSSIGAGPIPGWYEYQHNEMVPIQEKEGPHMSLRPTWLGGDGVQFGDHPFGVDNQNGRDLFAQTMRGVQVSLVVIVVLALLSVTLGVLIGALSGYFGGWLDQILMRVTDVILILPLLVIVAVAAFSFGWSGLWSVALALGIFSWTGLARLVRAEFLALREREFVDAARVAGASSWRIIFKHILPNTLGTIIVSTTLLMGGGILTEAALSYIGFGIQAPNVSLGSLASDYARSFNARPHLFVFPGVFIILIVLCLQFIGDGLRDAFDPRQKRIPKFKDLESKAQQVATQMVEETKAARGDLPTYGRQT
ncbi:MAG TPA: ABC transporter permease [Ilumatobacter sp.]|nr:ABC transporter permease [Ilumatobacter sp.]